MSGTPARVEKRIALSHQQADRLSRLALLQQTTEDHIVEKALDILFRVTELLDERAERREWSYTSEESLHRVWDNDSDAAYDDWREMYGVATG